MTRVDGWFVYIVRCADRTLYTGVAKDVRARVAAHNAGRGAKYTRARLPVKIVYEEAVQDRGAALRREHAIKRLPRLAKLALVKQSRGRARAARRSRARGVDRAAPGGQGPMAL